MSKMEQIRTTFGRFSDEYDRNLTGSLSELADLSDLTEFFVYLTAYTGIT